MGKKQLDGDNNSETYFNPEFSFGQQAQSVAEHHQGEQSSPVVQAVQQQAIDEVVNVELILGRNQQNIRRHTLRDYGFRATTRQFHTICAECGGKLSNKKSALIGRGRVCKKKHDKRIQIARKYQKRKP